MSDRDDRKIVQELVDGYGSWFAEENWRGGSSGRMTAELYPYEKLFSPVMINRLKIKNRIVMAPMGNLNMCDETGRPNDKMLQYFFARAKGGAGLLTTGLIPVSHGIDPSVTEPEGLSYFPRIDRSRTVLAGWRDLAQGVHAYGSRIFIQLTPGMGRVGNPQCAVNPVTGFEDVKPAHPSQALVRKKVAVAGGGPAGAVFALVAAERGHEVTLYEPGKIGGKLLAASVPKIKFDVENYVGYLQRRVKKAVSHGQIRWIEECATVEGLASGGFDAIVTASGTKEASPQIEGIEKMRTVQAPELLIHPELLGDASKVVVIGGESTGCETAYWLRIEKGCDVAVIEMMPELMKGVCTANRGYLLYYMKKSDIRVYNSTCVKSFGERTVNIEVNTDKNVPDPYNTWQPILPENVLNPLAPKIGKRPLKQTWSYSPWEAGRTTACTRLW